MDQSFGTVRVSFTTTGGDLDLDGYELVVAGAPTQHVDINAQIVIPTVPSGLREVRLDGIAANCTVAGENPRSVTVPRGETIDVVFAVACVATGVQVAVATSGIDFDSDGYTVSVDGAPPVAIGVSGTISVTRLSGGGHVVALSGVAANCTVGGENPRSVSIAAGTVVPVAFAVTCVAASGVVEITTVTTGIDLDASYAVQVDGGPAQPIGVNGRLAVPGLSGGNHTVRLTDIAGNCPVAGENPRTLSVRTGGATRDTARTTFEVSCVATTGVVEITTVTSGADLDVSYTVQVDASQLLSPIAGNGRLAVTGLAAGTHTIRLADVAGNCTVAGENPRTVSVRAGGTTRDTARTTFEVGCVATTGSVEVAVATTGTDIDPNGYTVYGDAYCYDYYGYEYCYYNWSRSVAANGTVTIAPISVGDHTVLLSDVAGNCAVSGDNPRAVTVTPGGTARVSFSVTCAPVVHLRVTTSTTGVELDPDGYGICIDPYPDAEYGYFCRSGAGSSANGVVTISGLSPAQHVVWLTGVIGNCTVEAPNPRTVDLSAGGTIDIALRVSCVHVEVLVPYQAAGYRFKVVASNTPGGGFELPGFDDSQAGFVTGSGAFGYNLDYYYGGCPLDPTARTAWPVNTDLLLRKAFVLPQGATNVRVSLAIDNDVQVFVNGVDITASAGSFALAEGFQKHGGCATFDSFVFTVPSQALVAGTNLVAIRARDRGGISFVDLRVTAQLP